MNTDKIKIVLNFVISGPNSTNPTAKRKHILKDMKKNIRVYPCPSVASSKKKSKLLIACPFNVLSIQQLLFLQLHDFCNIHMLDKPCGVI